MTAHRRKPCNECRVVKSLRNFPLHPNCADGHANVCKPCKRLYDRERQVLKAESLRAYRQSPKRIADTKVRLQAWLKTESGRASRAATKRRYRAVKRVTRMRQSGS